MRGARVGVRAAEGRNARTNLIHFPVVNNIRREREIFAVMVKVENRGAVITLTT